MRRFLFVALCTLGMLGVFFAVRYVVTGFGLQFGAGFVCGAFVMAILFWLNERLEKQAS